MDKNTAKIARNVECKVPEPGVGDRLSSLPDEIISHILSFLETHFAVETAILSRRWKDLWTTVPNLDINNRMVYRKEIKPPYAIDLIRKDMKRRESKFSRFVDRVLSQHRNLDSLQRFSFHLFITKRNWKVMQGYLDKLGLLFGSEVKEIDVKLKPENSYGSPPWSCIWWIPESFYTLKNLKVAKLNGVVMGAKGSVSLPSLKSFELLNVVIKDFESFSRLISGCPIVETLSLELCDIADMDEDDVLIASMPFLKDLRIIGVLDGDGYECLCRIVMEAPKLMYLYLEDSTELQFRGSSTPLLPCLYATQIDTSETGGSYDSLIRLLTQISNMKEMCLYYRTLEFLAGGDDVRRLVFPNLSQLTIQPTESCSSWILHSLLHSSPKLQSLDIQMGFSNGPMMWEEIEPTRTLQCLQSSLEEIEINGFVPFENDVKMVGNLINAGVVLKNVDIIVFRNPTKEQRKGLRSLLKLSRESSACEVCIVLAGGKKYVKFDDDKTYTDDEEEVDQNNEEKVEYDDEDNED